MESSEQVRNEIVDFLDESEMTARCRVVHTAEYVAERWNDCKRARLTWDDAVTDWQESTWEVVCGVADTKMQEYHWTYEKS